MGIDAEIYFKPPGDFDADAVNRGLIDRFGKRSFYNAACHRVFESHAERLERWGLGSEDEAAEELPDFYRLAYMGRYYGPGYERGDALEIIGIAEYLEHAIPGVEVRYGGDSGGVEALELFGSEQRAELRAHFLANGHSPYVDYFDHGDERPAIMPPCAHASPSFRQAGWGRNGLFAVMRCRNCGHSFRTEDGGNVWAED